jgi:hypothetical protein
MPDKVARKDAGRCSAKAISKAVLKLAVPSKTSINEGPCPGGE